MIEGHMRQEGNLLSNFFHTYTLYFAQSYSQLDEGRKNGKLNQQIQ
jgi:hypothetical protein